MSLLAHSALTILTRWGGFVLEGVASVLVARQTGPTGKGTLAVLNVVAGLAIQMGNFGLHAATTHFTARDPAAIDRIAWASLLLAPGIGLVIAGLLGVGIWALPALVPNVSWGLLAVTLATIPPAFVLLFFQNILLGQRRIGAYNLLDISGKLVALPLVVCILFVFRGGVPELVAAGAVLSYATAWLAVRLAFAGVAARFRLDTGLMRRMLGYGLRAYVACLLAYLIIRSDMLLVNYFLGTAQTGIYAVAVNLADLLLVFPTAIGAMLFPRISAAPADAGELTARVCRHTAAGMLFLGLGAGLVAPWLIRLLFGAAFAGAAGPFRLLLPGILALSLETILMNDLSGRGLPPVVILVPGVGLALNLALNLAFLPRYGLAAAALASSLAYLGMLGLAWKAFARRTGVGLSTCLLLRAEDLAALAARLRDWWGRRGAVMYSRRPTRGDGPDPRRGAR